ncbi:MAG TPA: CoA ester lyase [Acidimicrobiales bacterium]|jgi:citrate lyase subunit beta/citryl-CoA lyase|nr:CoA ester lyase [Acidimicrobiales bacterium]
MTPTPRIIRTIVFAPAHDMVAIEKAVNSGVDGVVLDMEDLTPEPSKDRAREVVPEAVNEFATSGVVMMARTNTLASGRCAEDLDAIVSPALHCVNLPKAESAADVQTFARLLDAAEEANGVDIGATLVRPVIETAAGVKWAYEIAAASPRVTYMGGVAGGFWGDLGASLGVVPSPDGRESLYLRSKVLVDVRAAGVRYPIGGGVTARTDLDGIREFMIENKQIGYTGAHCAPSRAVIEVVNEVFTPTRDEIADWCERIPILEEAKREGKVAFMHDGRMYDTAGLDRIRDQLALATHLGLLEG